MSLKANQDAKSIGTRFRSARSLVPLNRKSFCERHEINRYTMQSWENGLHVSKGKNVEKFIEALAHEGISCTSEWLIDGLGEPARPFSGSTKPYEQQDHLINLLITAHEDLDEEVISLTINDQVMMPKFAEGDWLLGARITSNPQRAHQKYCIVKLAEDRILVRKAFYFKENFLLSTLDDRTPSFTLGLDAKIYEVIWHRLA